jgi:hypothetical protein
MKEHDLGFGVLDRILGFIDDDTKEKRFHGHDIVID